MVIEMLVLPVSSYRLDFSLLNFLLGSGGSHDCSESSEPDAGGRS